MVCLLNNMTFINLISMVAQTVATTKKDKITGQQTFWSNFSNRKMPNLEKLHQKVKCSQKFGRNCKNVVESNSR
jgi:hypothetical protein